MHLVGVFWVFLSLALFLQVAAGVCEASLSWQAAHWPPQEVPASTHRYNAASTLQARRQYTDINRQTSDPFSNIPSQQ